MPRLEIREKYKNEARMMAMWMVFHLLLLYTHAVYVFRPCNRLLGAVVELSVGTFEGFFDFR